MDKAHDEIYKRLSRVKGQVDSLQEMAKAGEQLPKIAQQIRASYKILKRAEVETMRADLESHGVKGKALEDLIEKIWKLVG